MRKREEPCGREWSQSHPRSRSLRSFLLVVDFAATINKNARALGTRMRRMCLWPVSAFKCKSEKLSIAVENNRPDRFKIAAWNLHVFVLHRKQSRLSWDAWSRTKCSFSRRPKSQVFQCWGAGGCGVPNYSGHGRCIWSVLGDSILYVSISDQLWKTITLHVIRFTAFISFKVRKTSVNISHNKIVLWFWDKRVVYFKPCK